MPTHLDLVRSVAGSLAGARTVQTVAAAILDAVGPSLGAVTASVWTLDSSGTELRCTYEANADPGALARFGAVPLESQLPGPMVIRSGEPVFLRSKCDRDERWPQLAGLPSPSEAMIVLPLAVVDQRLGVVSFGFADTRDFDAEDRVALLAIADQCAVALDRARLYEAETRRATSNEVVAQISARMDNLEGNADWKALAAFATDACVGRVVDTCSVYLREGALLRRVACASEHNPQLRDLVERFPIPLSAAVPAAHAARSGQATPLGTVDGAVIAAASPSEEFASYVHEGGFGPGWAVPLRDADAVFGVMVFALAAGDDEHADFVEAAEKIAAATAALLRSAARFKQQRDVLEALHDSVLPPRVDPVGPFDVAVAYVPVTRQGIVGGDWWDAFELPGGRVAFAVGDVAGHGVEAIAVMGQLRNALRAVLVGGAGPAEALASLSRFLDWTAPDAHCSVIVAVVDADTGVATWADAGHPAPLLIQPGAAPEYLGVPIGPPVGLRLPRAAQPYEEVTVTMAPGATVLLFSDGLVEDRARGIDEGFAELVRAAARHLDADTPLQNACDRITAELAPSPTDDVCLFVTRRSR